MTWDSILEKEKDANPAKETIFPVFIVSHKASSFLKQSFKNPGCTINEYYDFPISSLSNEFT